MIHMKFSGLPPSVNHVYFTTVKSVGRKRVPLRVLTKDGKKYKTETLAYLSKNYHRELARFRNNAPHVMYIRLTMPDLETKGWPKTAQSRYKRIDASNHVKVLEDVIVEASGVDDSNYMTSICEKRKGPAELTEVWIWNLSEEGCPFHAAALSL